MITVTHLIAGLGKAGAETMLYNILKYSDRQQFQHIVISMGAGSYYENAIKQLNIPLYVFDIKKRPVSSLIKIRKLLHKSQVISCWMYHSCILGYFLTTSKQHYRLIWNIRHNNLEPRYNKRSTIMIAKCCAYYSKNVAMIVYNGKPAKELHERFGYNSLKSQVADNGCDTEKFKRDSNARKQLSIQLKLSQKKIILSIGRYHAIKDFPTIIRAMGLIKKRRADMVLIMCGEGLLQSNMELLGLLSENNLKLGIDVFLMGEQNDMRYWLSATDIYVLHSASEAFPNTLLEAMACECPCLSTDVGVVKNLLSEDEIIEVGDSNAMASKIEKILSLPEDTRKAMGIRNRNIVQAHYAISSVVRQYEKKYADIIS